MLSPFVSLYIPPVRCRDGACVMMRRNGKEEGGIKGDSYEVAIREANGVLSRARETVSSLLQVDRYVCVYLYLRKPP